MPNVEFIRSRVYNDSAPQPVIKTLPNWYKDADKYNENKKSTYKNCVSFFEGMSAGYALVTPCDIEFKIIDGVPEVLYDRNAFPSFVEKRPKMNQFHHPEGYYEDHFAWFPEWGVSLPEGYNALYVTPINRFDLPFVCTSGIINNDKVFRPGNVPFFLRKGFEGSLPAGTPYLHMLPFAREDWTSSQVDENQKEKTKFFSQDDYRLGNNMYREHVWVRTHYT